MTDEEKKAIEEMGLIIEAFYDFPNPQSIDFHDKDVKYLETILNLIDNQQKEIEEIKKENLEIRDWKYVIDTIEDLDKLKELDLIKIKGKKFINEDKIKARIKELEEYLYKGNIKDDFLMIRIKAKIQELQSLLEEE